MLNRPSRSLRRIAASTSALALATALATGQARAQLSYNAPDPTVASGNVTFVRGQTPGLEVYTVNSNTAVLDFTPNDLATGGGAINFQNANTTVRYERAGQGFTVLNRIVPADPTRAVQFNGTVESRIVNTITNPGGSVWFYSPGGIILGSGAVFDVGSLLLATGDPTGGSGAISSTNIFSIASKADSNAAVTIQTGAKINALQEGSYVALVAPVVNQNGIVKVNGNAAYVAAEQATLTFSGGLFDIQVTTGSDGGGTPLTHNGSTAGPSSTGAADKHGIYMVAVPKNSAITMAIAPTGQLGFDVAASATIENGAIYLQAGGNLSIDPTREIVNRINDLPLNAKTANININSGNITSALAAQATTNTTVFAGNPGLTLAQDTYLFAGLNATLTAGTGANFSASKNVIVNAFGNGASSKAQVDALAGSTMSFVSVGVHADATSGRLFSSGISTAQGGRAALRSTSGTITIADEASVTAIGSDSTGSFGGGLGGLADITANGGSITVTNNAFVDVSAQTGGSGGGATAGTGNVSAFGQSSIKAGFVLSISANASGSGSGTTTAGTALVSIGSDGGSIEAVAANLNADAVGADVLSGAAGSAVGGNAQISTAPAPSAVGSLKFDTTNLSAIATGGTGTSSATVIGGNATGGQARILINKDSTYTTTGSTTLAAFSKGGSGKAGGAGGSATQGDIQLSVFEGGAISFASATLNADTFGGAGGAGPSPTTAGGTGGAAIKGVGATVFAGGGGTVTGGKTQVLAIARSGAGGAGFSGTGFAGAGGAAEAGSAVISTDTGGKITLGETAILAGTTARDSGAGTANGVLQSGPALGGVSTLNAKAGTIELASVVMATDAIGGKGLAIGADGGDAFGGKAFVGATAGGTLKIGTARFEVNSSAVGGLATGGSAGNVSGGKAVAGSANLGVEVGSVLDTTATLVDFRVIATGGSVFSGPGTTGNAQAGQSFFNFAGKATFGGGLLLDARAIGGSSSGSGKVTGGTATGGNTSLFVNQGGIGSVVGSVQARASSFGGNGINGGAGGSATGASILINADNGALGAGSFSLLANTSAGSGGSAPDAATPGGAGGAALAGSGISIFVSNGGSVTGGNAFLDATAAGGTGGDGFGATGLAGSGGSATAANTFAGVNGGQLLLGSLRLQSNAIAGAGGSGTAQAPGTGVVATGGNAIVSADNGLIQVSSLSAQSNAFGNPARALGANGNKAVAQTAAARATNNGTLKITSEEFDLSAEAFGGDASGVPGGATVQAGEAVGGIAEIFAGTGATVDSAATNVFLDASGDGGAEQGTGNVVGAIGRGGNARINANGGTIILRGGVRAIADGLGGDGGGTGAGGAGIGGEARLGTFGAVGTSKVQVTGELFLDARGSGGGAEAGLGGDGLGGTPPSADTGPFNKGAYLVAIGGEVTIDGNVDMDASGFGGFSPAGGGAGVGGRTNFVSFGAAMTVAGATFMDSSGVGGDAFSGAGGKGGAGTGGFALLSSTSGGDSQGGGVIPVGTPSSILLADLQLNASGQGGDGGDGADGQAGGQGGDGTAGVANALAQAGSGQLKTGDLFIFLQGTGGQGADGGVAPVSGGLGGAGGQGGAGIGGFSNFGTASGPDTTGNDGSATFAAANVFLFGVGGDGGAGAGTVTGGAGGSGSGGTGTLLSRGSPVVATTLNINSSAFGGQGGTSGLAGAVQGAAGAADGGAASLLVTNRSMRTEPGSFAATDVTLSAGAFPSIGGTAGVTTAGQALAQVTKSSATVGTLSLITFGASGPPTGSETGLVVDAGTLVVADDTSLSAIGDLNLSVVNAGTFSTGSLSLDATGSLIQSVTGTPGQIDVGAGFIANFGGNFVTAASFAVDGSFLLSAGGELKLGDVKAGDSISLSSERSITTGNLEAALGDPTVISGDVEIAALGSVTTGDVKAATIGFQVGDPTAPVAVQTGNLTAETISLDIGGSLIAGNITSADLYTGIDTSEDSFLIGIGVLGDVKVGVVDALTSVGVGSVTGKVENGAIRANDSIMLLAATSVSTGGITGGTDANDSVFLSNTSIIKSNPEFAVLQDFDELGGLFDIDVLATATPVRVGGAIALGGPVSTVNFAAATTQSFASGAIAAPGRLFLDVGGPISGGKFSTGGALTLSSDQDITVANLTATSVNVKSGQNVFVGSVNASGAVVIEATRFADFDGQVLGSSIDITSGDISIGSTAVLGGSGTGRLTLTATGSSPRFGGTVGDTQYSLSSDEAQRLRAQSIELRSDGSALVGEMSLLGSGAGSSANLIGDNGQLLIASDNGPMTVVGQVVVNNAASGNQLTLRAGEGLSIATDQGGGAALFGSSPSELGGTLVLQSDSLRVATSSLLGQLGSQTPAQRAQALAVAPSGAARPQGYLQANRIEFRVDEVLIQNSNTASQFGGFSAGAGGATLRGFSRSQVDAVVFGRIANSSGAFKINQDAVPLLTLGAGEGAATVTSTSLFNNCSFTGGACGTVQPPPPPPPPEEEAEQELLIDRIPAVIQAALTSAMASTSDPETVAALPTINLVTTIDTAPLRTEPVITDPVTGGGNASLWEAADRDTDGAGQPSRDPGDEQ